MCCASQVTWPWSLCLLTLSDSLVTTSKADHGVNSKSTLYEGGVRIPQFVHYPNKISAGMKFDSPVSVIDTSATVLDYAGITPSYDIDGSSWKEVIVEGSKTWENRCLFFEMHYDRAVRCGCYKYLEIYNTKYSNTFRKGNVSGLSHDGQNLFNLCGNSDSYVTEIKGGNMEVLKRSKNVISKRSGMMNSALVVR